MKPGAWREDDYPILSIPFGSIEGKEKGADHTMDVGVHPQRLAAGMRRAVDDRPGLASERQPIARLPGVHL